MEPVSLPLKTTLSAAEVTPKYGHFLTSGISSVVTFMEDGGGSEVTVVGPEGLVEMVHLLGPARVPTSAFMQISGTALRIPYAVLQREMQTAEVLRERILQFAQHQLLMLGQLTACNRLHGVNDRLARWLLMVQDRVGGDMLPLTQEFLAEMLGSRRTSVSLAAGELQRMGLIAYRRGMVRILDRPGLIKRSCECYPVVEGMLRNLYT